MKNTLQKYIAIILLSIMLTDCWNRREMNTLAIIQAIGIDITQDKEYCITLQIIKPSEIKFQGGKSGGGVGQGNTGVTVITSTGRTIFDAFKNTTLEVSRIAFQSYNKIVIIGEEAARSGIGPITDYLSRNNETRRLAYILIARGKARDIIGAGNEQEKIPSHAIEGAIKTSFTASKIPNINLRDFFKALSSKSSDPFAAGIEIKNKEEDNMRKVVKLNGTAIFNEDKLIGWFNEKETRGLLWILGEVKNGVIIVSSPKEETKEVSLGIIRASSKISAEMINDELTITVKVKEEGRVEEQLSQVDLSKPAPTKELEKKQAEVIKKEINSALEKAQKVWNVDIQIW